VLISCFPQCSCYNSNKILIRAGGSGHVLHIAKKNRTLAARSRQGGRSCSCEWRPKTEQEHAKACRGWTLAGRAWTGDTNGQASRGWTGEEACTGEVNRGWPGARRASADCARRLDEGPAGGIVGEGEAAAGLTRCDRGVRESAPVLSGSALFL
jgi:hypothetical protein